MGTNTIKVRENDEPGGRAHENRQGNWHVLKEIPVATLFALAVQTAAGIWWAASMSAKVDSLEKTVLHMQSAQAATDAKQDAEVMRSEARVISQLEKLNGKLDRLIENGGRANR